MGEVFSVLRINKVPWFSLKTIKFKITEKETGVFSWVIFLNFPPPTTDQPCLRFSFSEYSFLILFYFNQYYHNQNPKNKEEWEKKGNVYPGIMAS